MNNNVCMIAHRGLSSLYPDNTEIAFIKAAENGSGGAETDIRITRDGIPVLCHNREAVFYDGTVRTVRDSTFSELTEKPLFNNKSEDTVYLCTFRKYLEIMRDNNMICFVELKDDFSEQQIKEIFSMVSEVYELKKCILQSFDFENLIKAHSLFPDLPLMLTYGSNESGYERCFDYGFSLDIDYKVCNKKTVDDFHAKGLEVAVWTANSEEALLYSRKLGVDYIESDVFGG